MRVHKPVFLMSLAFACFAAGPAVQAQRVPEEFTISGAAAERLNDYLSINSATAERLAQTCFEIIRQEADVESATIVVLNPYGLVVHQHSKDGQRYISIKITESKARVALLTREPSLAVLNTIGDDTHRLIRYEQIGIPSPAAGGVPIIVNGQMIGALAIGGFAGGEQYNTIANLCLEAVFGPQL